MEQLINPHDLTLTISLKKEDQKRMQLVYASQLYGTFFTVFGSFDLEYHNDKPVLLKGVCLRLINYKGQINLGLVSVTMDPVLEEIDKQENSKSNEVEKELTIHFRVQALQNNDVLKYFRFTEPMNIEGLKNLVFQRELLPIHNVDKMSAVHSGVFDSEFFDRDGLFTRKNTLRMDEETMDDWSCNKHTGRRYKEEMCNEPFNPTTENYDYGTVITEYEDMDCEKDNQLNIIKGGRCPKALSITTY